jgi:hypothetical protein
LFGNKDNDFAYRGEEQKEMNILPHTIAVTARLELNAREVELLENITSYGNKRWADIICGQKSDDANSYNGRVSNKEVVLFMDNLRDVAGKMKAIINDSKERLIR